MTLLLVKGGRDLTEFNIDEEEANFKCEVCDSEFDNMTDLEFHHEMCSYPCEVEGCGESFKDDAALLEHYESVHIGKGGDDGE